MNDGPDYGMQEANEAEAWEFLQEQDAKRRMRGLEVLEEMRKGLDDPDDEAFRKRIEDMHPWLKQWEKGQLT